MEENSHDKKAKDVSESCPIEIPANFDVDKILSEVTCRADKKAGLKNAIFYILHSLIQQMKTREGKDLLDKDGLVYLHSKILGKICGNRYTEALRLLQKAQVIYRTDGYSPGNRSKGVCLLGDYAAAEIDYRELSPGSIRKKVIKHRIEQEQKNAVELAKIPYITKWFNEKLTINVEAAHNFTELYSFKLKKTHQSSSISSQDLSNRINNRYNSSRVSVDKIASGDFGLKKTGNDHRLHSSVSSIKKELRSCLTYDGEQLFGIDVKSSQPYLLAQLLNPEFYTEGNNGINIYTLYPEIAEVISEEQLKDILMSVTYNHSFTDVQWDDDFYTSFLDLDAKRHPLEKPYFKDRDDVKKKMMVVLYDKKHKGKAFHRFAAIFPREAALISLFHRMSNKDENFLPILMQRLESKLMLEIVCKKISDRLPDAPIIPVHDCILTTAPYMQDVKNIMEEVLISYTEIKPGLTFEMDTAEDRLDNLNLTAEDDYKELKQNVIKNKYKANVPVNAKAPALKKIPTHKGDQVLATRYIDENEPDYNNEFDETNSAEGGEI